MLLKELVRDSFVPDGNPQRHRQYGFQINEINKDLVRCEQRIDMILQRCNIRLSNYVSRTKTRATVKWWMPSLREKDRPKCLSNSFMGERLTGMKSQSCTMHWKDLLVKMTGIYCANTLKVLICFKSKNNNVRIPWFGCAINSPYGHCSRKKKILIKHIR